MRKAEPASSSESSSERRNAGRAMASSGRSAAAPPGARAGTDAGPRSGASPARPAGESRTTRARDALRERAPEPAATGGKLAGSLARVPFPALLHHLHGLRATGVLHLSEGKKRKWIELRDGQPVAVRSNLVNECLGNFLVRTGRLSQAEVTETRRLMRPGRLQGEILVAMKLLSEEEVTASLRAQADEKLFEIFAWESGAFRFERDERLERANALGVDRSPANLILQGVRRRFSGERIDAFLRAHADRRPVPSESPYYRYQEVDLSPRQRTLLSGLDGTRALADIVASDPSLSRTLYALVATGLIELLGPGGENSVSQRRVRWDAGGAALAEPGRADAPVPPEEESRRAELAGLAERFRGRDLFRAFGLDENASDLEIRVVYARLAERVHPDRFARNSDAVRRLAADVFARASQAYEILCDPRRRVEYLLDRRRAEREAAELAFGENTLRAERSFQEGERLLASRAFEDALVCFGRALELNPDEGEYHAHYGWALHLCHPADRELAQEAIEHVKRGLKLAGHREKPYLYLGRLYKATGRADDAERMFARALQLRPDSIDAQRELRLIDLRRQKSKGLIGRLWRR